MAAANPALIGKTVELTALKRSLAPIRPLGLLCGADPEHERGCTPFSAAPIELHGKQHYLYISVSKGISSFFFSFSGLRHLLSLLAPGILFSLIFSTVLAIFIGRYLTRELRSLARTLRRYAEGDFSTRYEPVIEDEVAALGNAANRLADTVRFRRNELAQTIDRRTRLLASLVHDLRRPLLAVQLVLERALNAPQPVQEDNSARSLQSISGSLEAERILLSGLKEISSTATLTDPERFAALSLNAVVTEALQQLEPVIAERGQHLECELSPAIPNVFGQREQLYRALLNLLDNAVKYTPPGGSLTVRTFTHDSLANFEVVDSGIGIPESERELIFEPSYRSLEARSTNPSGTGLGLSIVKSIVTAHGGLVTAATGETIGSVFRVVLPTETNRIVSLPELAQHPVQRRTDQRRMRSARRAPGTFLFETATALGLSSSYLFLLEARHRPSLFPHFLLCGFVIAGLCATRTRRAESSPLQGAYLILRSVLLGLLGLLVVELFPYYLVRPSTAQAFMFIEIVTFITCVGTLGRSRRAESLPIGLALGVPLALAVLRRSLPMDFLAVGASWIIGWLTVTQVHATSYRILSIRIGTALSLLYFNTAALQAIALSANPARALLEHPTVMTPSLLKSLQDSLERAARSGVPNAFDIRAIQLTTESPRLALRIGGDTEAFGGPPWMVALSDSFPFPPDVMAELLSQFQPQPTIAHSHGRDYGLLQIPSAGRRIVVIPDGGATSIVLRHLGDLLIGLVLISCGISVSIISFIVSRFAFRGIRLRLLELTAALRSFRLGKALPMRSASSRREIDTLEESMHFLCREIERALLELTAAERQTAALVDNTRLVLEEHASEMAKIAREASGPFRPVGQRLLEVNNAKTDFLTDVFDYATLENGEFLFSSREVGLRDCLEDAVLDFVSRRGKAGAHQIRIVGGESTLISGDERILVRVFRNILIQLLEHVGPEGEVYTIAFSESPEACGITFPRARGDTSAPDPRNDIRRLLNEHLLKLHDAEISSEKDTVLLRFRSTRQRAGELFDAA